MKSNLGSLGARLSLAREAAGFSQDEVALLVDQPRTVISNWESGKRRPHARHLAQLASIYRVPFEEMVGISEPIARPGYERLFFRDAGDRLAPEGKYEVQTFLAFLDGYADLLEALEEPPGLVKSPFSVHEGFSSKDDVRRKAEQVRDFLGIGAGPIDDLIGLADLAGIAVYQAALGTDLKATVSGAFLPHDRVGFSVLLNSQTTPGRQKFTLAHEFAHAFFHGDKMYIAFFGRREAQERFADAFASEFLVPVTGLRAAAETFGITKVRDPEEVVHLQRFFHVSYAMMLVRLRSANLVTEVDFDRLKGARPVHLAEALGYSTARDEWSQDPDRWGLAKFPRRFLRLLRSAFKQEIITVGGAAALTGLASEDIEEFLIDKPPEFGDEQEFDYFSASA